MSLVAYQEIWNLLNEYQFDIDILSHSDLVCLICSKVIKNACQTVCGCKFCLECIKQYLSGEEKCCPRQIDDCKDQIINFQRDVMIDNATNRKISQIQVKCPESFCQYNVELSKMQPHIKSHQIKCPYSDIGCNQPKLGENKLIDHLSSENAFHTTLLLNSIQNLKNEIDILHDKVNHKEKLIENLKNENFQLKNEVELLKTENIEINRPEIYLMKKNWKDNQSLIEKLLEKIVESENERFKLDDRIRKIENTKKSMNEIQEKMNQIIIRNRTVRDNSDSDESTNSSVSQRNGRRPYEPGRCRGRGRGRGRGRSCGRQRSYVRRGYRSSSEDRINDNPQPL